MITKLKRLIDLTPTDAAKIRARQKAGTMTEYYDNEGYTCYDEKELENYKKSKPGRKPVQSVVFGGNISSVLRDVERTIALCKEKGITTLAELIEYDECLKNKQD